MRSSGSTEEDSFTKSTVCQPPIWLWKRPSNMTLSWHTFKLDDRGFWSSLFEESKDVGLNLDIAAISYFQVPFMLWDHALFPLIIS